MARVYKRHEARLRGSNEATRQWLRLGLDADYAVDVFGIVEDAGIWLLFEPLKDLFGFFQRGGASAGMVLHSGHPVSLQRFTAAHEYGHYVLGHDVSTDSERELFSTANVSLQEVEAQAFAADFLMPLQVVNRALDRLSIPPSPSNLEPAQAYQLSLEMGSSYTATLAQLCHLNKISGPQLEKLRRVRPIDLKAELGGGRRPANSRADAWLVTEEVRGREIVLRVDDELHVRLPELPASGYRWQAVFDGALQGLELVEDSLEAGDVFSRTRFGGARERHLWWRATAPVDGTVQLGLRRPWEGEGVGEADEYSVAVSIAPPRAGSESGNGIGISSPQRRAMLRAVQ